MSEPVLLLVTLNFIFVGLLPKLFFRQEGRFNLMWWMTALPFFLSPATMVLAFLGCVSPIRNGTRGATLDFAAVVLSVASIALLFLTIGTHRIPIALWHQNNDAPREIVTYGAYGRIRHPFYSSFILAFASAVAYCPHPLTFFAFGYGILILNFTAAREESRLVLSEFGAEYREYMTRTGRFFPRVNPGR